MKQRTRVLIADDRTASRKGLRAILGIQPELEIIGEAIDGQQAVCMVEELLPDVVLMDVSMPVLDGLEATRRIKGRWPEVRIVVLTMYGMCQADAQAAGANAFLVKGCPTEELLEAVVGDCSKPTPRRQERSRKERKETDGFALQVARAWCAL